MITTALVNTSNTTHNCVCVCGGVCLPGVGGGAPARPGGARWAQGGQGWVGPGFPLFSTHAAAAFVAVP